MTASRVVCGVVITLLGLGAGRARAAEEASGAVDGSVVDTTSDAPLSPVTVMLFPASGPAITRNTDATGTFHFGPIPPGEYTLAAFFGSANARKDALPVKAGEVTRVTLRFDLTPEVVRIPEKRPKITPPVPIRSSIPRVPPYSEEAILTNMWGVAWLLLQVDEHGAVVDVKVLKGPGHGLEPLAIETAKKFRFRPGHDAAGNPIAMQFIYVMEWPSYWARINGFPMIPPCKGEAPLNLDSINPIYRDCEPPPGLAHLRLAQPRPIDAWWARWRIAPTDSRRTLLR